MSCICGDTECPSCGTDQGILSFAAQTSGGSGAETIAVRVIAPADIAYLLGELDAAHILLQRAMKVVGECANCGPAQGFDSAFEVLLEETYKEFQWLLGEGTNNEVVRLVMWLTNKGIEKVCPSSPDVVPTNPREQLLWAQGFERGVKYGRKEFERDQEEDGCGDDA